jgi:hypothetical protein
MRFIFLGHNNTTGVNDIITTIPCAVREVERTLMYQQQAEGGED